MRRSARSHTAEVIPVNPSNFLAIADFSAAVIRFPLNKAGAYSFSTNSRTCCTKAGRLVPGLATFLWYQLVAATVGKYTM